MLAANVVEVESCPWDYQTILSHDGKDVKVSFCPIPPPKVQEDIFTSSVMSMDNQDMVQDKQNSGEKPKFGSQPKYGSPEFNFKKELDRLPFPLNLGKVEMSKEQQVRFLELIYDNQSVFSLCDKDLGLCDRLKHTIPMTTWTNQFTCHTTPYQFSFKLKYGSVWIPGLGKV